MSHIDNALKKAQKEKDNTYQRYSRIRPVATHRSNTGRRIGLVIVVAVALISLAAIVLPVFENSAREPGGHVVAADKDRAKPDTFKKTGQRAFDADNLYKKALS